MKKISSILAASFLMIGMYSCESSQPKEEKENVIEEKITDPVCEYHYFTDSTHFEWVAYKTTDKKGVPGGFNDIEVTSVSSENPMVVLRSLKFKMNTASVETNNEERNGKVAKHFFETINTPFIEGKMMQMNEKNAIFEITMNGILVEVQGPYTFENDVFSFETVVDVSAWNALEGIAALNAECSDLHTGEDGVSKLWSEVKLSFRTTLIKDCE